MVEQRSRVERSDGLGWFLREHVEQLADWPAELERPSAHFALFLALDARALDSAVLAAFAQRMLADGLAYLVAWGPDCERVHDIFDSCIVEREIIRNIASPGCVMTTWHDDEPLAEALEYFATCAIPYESEWSCQTWLAVSVKDQAWFEEIGEALFNFSV